MQYIKALPDRPDKLRLDGGTVSFNVSEVVPQKIRSDVIGYELLWRTRTKVENFKFRVIKQYQIGKKLHLIYINISGTGALIFFICKFDNFITYDMNYFKCLKAIFDLQQCLIVLIASIIYCYKG